MQDIEIKKMLFNRDEKGISEIIKKYDSLCRALAFNVLRSDEEAKECVNDVYFVIWRLIPPNNPKNLKAYVCKITRMQALKKLEYTMAKKRHIGGFVSIDELKEFIPDSAISDKFNEMEITHIMKAFLKCEKKESRVVFIRKYWFFDTISEIAEKYNFSESKVKSMLYHTKLRLKEYLKQEGIMR